MKQKIKKDVERYCKKNNLTKVEFYRKYIQCEGISYNTFKNVFRKKNSISKEILFTLIEKDLIGGTNE